MLHIKGTRDGILITLDGGEWQEMRTALLEHLDSQAEFLKGARISLEVGDLALKAAEMGSLRDEVSERGMALWAVVSRSAVTEQTAQMLGLATRLHNAPEKSVRQGGEARPGEDALLIRRTLRSGFRLEYEGHVVVVGDVNPGAEIISGGDVIVWGKLKGTVHAGAQGNEGAVVCALELAPTQLRIAGQVAVTPEKHRGHAPETARIQNGRVLAEPWNPA